MRFGYCAASSGSLVFCDGVPGSLVGVPFRLSARRRPVLASPTGAPLPETPLVASDLPAAPLGLDGRRPALAEWALVTAMTVLAAWPWLVLLAVFTPVLWLLSDPAPYMWLVVWSAQIWRGPPVPGRPVTVADEPDLHARIGEVAERLGTGVPRAVHIVPTPEAMICQPRRSVRSPWRRSRVVLVLGLPLLEMLTDVQLTALVAHELAHVSPSVDRRGRALSYAQSRLLASRASLLRPPRVVCAPLLRATREWSWRVELEADATAAALVGTRAAREALIASELLDSLFDGHARDWVATLAAERAYPADLYAALAVVLRDPVVLSRAPSLIAADATVAAALPAYLISHPPTTDRLGALASSALPADPPRPFAAVQDADRPMALYTGTSLRAWAARELAGVRAKKRRPLAERRVLDEAPERFDPPLGEMRRLLARAVPAGSGPAEPGTRHGPAGSGTRTGPAARAVLLAALDMTGDGRWPDLAARIEPGLRRRVPAPARPTLAKVVVAGFLGQLVAAELRAAGWPRASRWSSAVVVGPSGQPFDAVDAVTRAIHQADPSELSALLAAAPGG